MDKFSRSDLIAFNRCDESTDKGICRKTARAMSPGAQIMFENTDGSIDDGRDSLTLPYDINASEITVDDTDFDMFYVDAADNPDNYVGKTIKIKGMMFKHPRLKKGEYILVDKSGYITLTPAGLEIAQKIYERHTLLTAFLTRLGVDPAIAAEDACKMEHVISDSSFEAIKSHVGRQQKQG